MSNPQAPLHAEATALARSPRARTGQLLLVDKTQYSVHCDIAKVQGEMALSVLVTSRTITELTGARSRVLHELCKDLGVGKTQQGAERRFSLEEAALVALVAQLSAQGLRRVEAIAIALESRDALERFLHNPDAPQRWLFAHRLPETEQWRTEVVDGSGSPEILDSAGDRAIGYIIVNLRTLARSVIEANDREPIKAGVRRRTG